MKKVLISLVFLFCAVASFAYEVRDTFPNTQSASNALTLFIYKGALKAAVGGITTNYPDTTTANTTPLSDYSGAIIFVNDTIWVRDVTKTRWITIQSAGGGTVINDTIYTRLPIYVDTVSSPGKRIIAFLQANGLISGGVVTVDSCMTIDISAPNFIINYRQYQGVAFFGVVVTPADPSLPRIDRVVVDTNLQITVIAGTPSVSPTAPPYNSFSQISLAEILVPAGATCLPATQEIIFDGVGDFAGQWTPTTAGTGSTNFVNTANPYHLTQASYTVTYTNGYQIIYTKPSGTDTVKPTSILKGFVTFIGGLSLGNQISAQWYNGTTAVSSQLLLNAYFNPNDSNVYQMFIAPLNAWSWTGGGVFNKLVLTFGGDDIAGSKGLYLDWIQLQTGIGTLGKQYVDSSRVINNHLVDFYNGIPVIRDSIGGGGSGGTQTLQQVFDTEVGGSVLTKPDSILISPSSSVRIKGATSDYYFGDSQMQFTQDDGAGTLSFFLSSPAGQLLATVGSTISTDIDKVRLHAQTSPQESNIDVYADSIVLFNDPFISPISKIKIRGDIHSIETISDSLVFDATTYTFKHVPVASGTSDSALVIDRATNHMVMKAIAGSGGGGGSQALSSVLINGNNTQRQYVFNDSSATAGGSGATWFRLFPQNYLTNYGTNIGTSGAFSQGYAYFPGVNADGRPNVVAKLFGYNGGDGASTIAGEPSAGVRFETHFQVGTEVLIESHGITPEIVTRNGVIRRLGSVYSDDSTGASSYALKMDQTVFYQGNTDTVNLAMSAGNIEFGLNTNGHTVFTNKRKPQNLYDIALVDGGTNVVTNGYDTLNAKFTYSEPIVVIPSTVFGTNQNGAIQANVTIANHSALNIQNSAGGAANIRGIYALPATTGTFTAFESLNLSAGTNIARIGGNGGTMAYQLYDYGAGRIWNMSYLSSATEYSLRIGLETDSNFIIKGSTGNAKIKYSLGIGTADPTARLMLPASTATASTGQLKFVTGTLPTTPEIGLMNMSNGLWYLDSSNSIRDTIATRRWARNNISGGGGGGNTIYTGDDAITSNRTVDLSGNILSFTESGNSLFSIDPVAHQAQIRSLDPTGADNIGTLSTAAGATDVAVDLTASFNGGANEAFITLFAQSGSTSITHTADAHIFLGTVRLFGYTVATLPASPVIGDVAYVTNALTPVYHSTVVGGGAVVTVVFYNGSAWIVN